MSQQTSSHSLWDWLGSNSSQVIAICALGVAIFGIWYSRYVQQKDRLAQQRFEIYNHLLDLWNYYRLEKDGSRYMKKGFDKETTELAIQALLNIPTKMKMEEREKIYSVVTYRIVEYLFPPISAQTKYEQVGEVLETVKNELSGDWGNMEYRVLDKIKAQSDSENKTKST
jgi:hypothetical protein